MLFRLFICTLFIHNPYVHGTYYLLSNATEQFREFKEKYNKVYLNRTDERNHYFLYINSLNAASELNDTKPDNNKTIYVINKYADLDPTEVKELYGISIKTFDAVNEDHHDLLQSDHRPDINDKNLYNLKKSDNLFKKYMKEVKSNVTTGRREDYLIFYKFVKALAKKNRGIYEGKEAPGIGRLADIHIEQ